MSPWWLGVTLELRRTGGGGLTVFTDERRAILEAPRDKEKRKLNFVDEKLRESSGKSFYFLAVRKSTRVERPTTDWKFSLFISISIQLKVNSPSISLSFVDEKQRKIK